MIEYSTIMVNIIFEDEYLLAVNKPAGILVVPTSKGEKYTLTSLVKKIMDERGLPINPVPHDKARGFWKKYHNTAFQPCSKERGFKGGGVKVYPCHRLDRDTSGIVLFAKDKETEQKMFLQFKQRRIRKKYIALVSGYTVHNSGVINKKIEGIEAVTKYRVIKKREGYSVLEAEPITGRTNQIRIHLKSIGNPVLGERKYAFGKDFKVKFRRTALHARELSFMHPITGKIINLKAALPDDMKKII